MQRKKNRSLLIKGDERERWSVCVCVCEIVTEKETEEQTEKGR